MWLVLFLEVAPCGVGRSPSHGLLLVLWLLAQIFQPAADSALSASLQVKPFQLLPTTLKLSPRPAAVFAPQPWQDSSCVILHLKSADGPGMGPNRSLTGVAAGIRNS